MRPEPSAAPAASRTIAPPPAPSLAPPLATFPTIEERLAQRKDLAALGERIAEHAVHLDAAMHRLLTDLRGFDQGGAAGAAFAPAPTGWPGASAGTWAPRASTCVRVARALATLPKLSAALGAGAVSYSTGEPCTAEPCYSMAASSSPPLSAPGSPSAAEVRRRPAGRVSPMATRSSRASSCTT